LPVFGVFSVSGTGRLVYLPQSSDRNAAMTVIANWITRSVTSARQGRPSTPGVHFG
jgi:hypothetical protein